MVVAVALAMFPAAIPAQQIYMPLLRNGSFESPVLPYGFQNWRLPDYWSLSSGGLPMEIRTRPIALANYLSATDGSQMLALYGDTISQSTTVSLAAGAHYLLSFDQSAPQNVGNSPQDALLNLSITDGTQTLTETFLVLYATPAWSHQEYEFVAADDAAYSVSLASSNNSDYMSIIDNVSLVPVPEPSSSVLLLVAGAFAVLRYRQIRRTL